MDTVLLSEVVRDIQTRRSMEECRELGARMKAFESALNFRNMGLPAEQVARGTGLSLEEFNELANKKNHGIPIAMEGTILGIADCVNGYRYAIMRLSENQAIIHKFAPGERLPDVGTKAVLTIGTDDEAVRDIQREEGIKEAGELGRELGARMKAFESALNFLNMGLPAEQVARGTGLSLEELDKLANEKIHGNPGTGNTNLTAFGETDIPLMDKLDIYDYGIELMKEAGAENIPHPIDVIAEITMEGTILGITDGVNGHRYAIMRLSENQAIIHKLAPGERLPDVGTKAVLTIGTSELSTAPRRDEGQTQTRGVKR
jgi:cytidylate kinase